MSNKRRRSEGNDATTAVQPFHDKDCALLCEVLQNFEKEHGDDYPFFKTLLRELWKCVKQHAASPFSDLGNRLSNIELAALKSSCNEYLHNGDRRLDNITATLLQKALKLSSDLEYVLKTQEPDWENVVEAEIYDVDDDLDDVDSCIQWLRTRVREWFAGNYGIPLENVRERMSGLEFSVLMYLSQGNPELLTRLNSLS